MKKQLNKKQLKKSTGGASAYEMIIDTMHKDLDKIIEDGMLEFGKHIVVSKAYLACSMLPPPPHSVPKHITYEELEKEADRYIKEKTSSYWW